MAQMIPDRLPGNSSRGEQRLFAALQRLPDDCLVYYEPVIAFRYPDFVVIVPDLGVLVIEVKGWLPGEILGGDRNELRIRERTGEQLCPHPVRRSREYMWVLHTECQKSSAAAQLLLHRDGEYRGRFVFPFTHFAVLSNIDARQLRGHPLGDLTAVFPAEQVVPRDVLLRWEGLTATELRAELARFFRPSWEFPRLTPAQVDAIRAVVHPEIVIAQKPGADTIAVLDLRQERQARSIGDGHRIVYGVAGSGKTVILQARARMLAELSMATEKREILVLCFNVSLAAALRAGLADLPNVRVQHFDGWAKRNGTVRQLIGDRMESDAELGDRLYEVLNGGGGDARRYDAVLVDESQDWDPSWFRCVVAALTEPEDGDLLIFGDRQQGIRKTNAVVWSQVGVRARGRTASMNLGLDVNYRNTREILSLAAVFAQDTPELDEDRFGSVLVDPSRAVRSNGFEPTLLRLHDRRAECQAVSQLVRMLLGQGEPIAGVDGPLRPGDIGILYPRVPIGDQQLMGEFLAELGTLAPVVWLKGQNRTRVGEPGVKVQTIHGAKGLQYPAVIVLWADLLPTGLPDSDPGEDAKLMYVALTRPQDYLFLTYSGTSGFLDQIRASGRGRWYPGEQTWFLPELSVPTTSLTPSLSTVSPNHAPTEQRTTNPEPVDTDSFGTDSLVEAILTLVGAFPGRFTRTVLSNVLTGNSRDAAAHFRNRSQFGSFPRMTRKAVTKVIDQLIGQGRVAKSGRRLSPVALGGPLPKPDQKSTGWPSEPPY